MFEDKFMSDSGMVQVLPKFTIISYIKKIMVIYKGRKGHTKILVLLKTQNGLMYLSQSSSEVGF